MYVQEPEIADDLEDADEEEESKASKTKVLKALQKTLDELKQKKDKKERATGLSVENCFPSLFFQLRVQLYPCDRHALVLDDAMLHTLFVLLFCRNGGVGR